MDGEFLSPKPIARAHRLKLLIALEATVMDVFAHAAYVATIALSGCAHRLRQLLAVDDKDMVGSHEPAAT